MKLLNYMEQGTIRLFWISGTNPSVSLMAQRNMACHANSPPLSYFEALAKLGAVASSQKCRHVVVESLSLKQAIGGIAAYHHASPRYRERVAQQFSTFRVRPGMVAVGDDLGQMLLPEGDPITLGHVLPLAAAGYVGVSVHRLVRIAIVSTGNGFLSQASQVSPERDINGPYLTVAATSLGFEADFLGTAADPAAPLRHLCNPQCGAGMRKKHELVPAWLGNPR
ncbi:hypothetical protein B0T14DRAFT_568174 [Immersiella caudata]|uniref:Uncharacterized protein n=1 Tax=Immersiella caudata TaxID=314043 RepID=A0AA39WJK2_9PEZI|nr:hypothetical protein B0T14DRAFT_568174 [Immersiella caudata]